MINPYICRNSTKVYDSGEFSDSLRDNGYVILKNFYEKVKVRESRELFIAELNAVNFERKRKITNYPNLNLFWGDLLSFDSLRGLHYVFFQRELIDLIRTHFDGSNVFYWGDSSAQMGEGLRGFHKDNVARADGTHSDWGSDYSLLRCGFYFQDHVDNPGGLKVRDGSHEYPDIATGRIKDIYSEEGDLVVWNMRLTHSGNFRKLKFSDKNLDPSFETHLPSWMFRDEGSLRLSCFCAFGTPGAHLDSYLESMRSRPDEYEEHRKHSSKVKTTLFSNLNLMVAPNK
jgi:hypothetical protein